LIIIGFIFIIVGTSVAVVNVYGRSKRFGSSCCGRWCRFGCLSDSLFRGWSRFGMTSLSTAVVRILEDIQVCVFKISKKPKKAQRSPKKPTRQGFLSSFNMQNLNVTKSGALECKGTCGLVPTNVYINPISIRGEGGRLRPTHRLFPANFFTFLRPCREIL